MISVYIAGREGNAPAWFVWDDHAATNPKACIMEYWPATSRQPAEVNYFAGGPSSSTWLVPTGG